MTIITSDDHEHAVQFATAEAAVIWGNGLKATGEITGFRPSAIDEETVGLRVRLDLSESAYEIAGTNWFWLAN